MTENALMTVLRVTKIANVNLVAVCRIRMGTASVVSTALTNSVSHLSMEKLEGKNVTNQEWTKEHGLL